MAVLTGFQDDTDHAEKARGFLDAIGSYDSDIEIIDVVETMMMLLYQLAEKLVALEIDGVYINTATATIGGSHACSNLKDTRMTCGDRSGRDTGFLSKGVSRQ